jgi:prolyl-tRNA editing enzyme YbaK/EbsC (Cys-tRNA(Pro) deacylase)
MENSTLKLLLSNYKKLDHNVISCKEAAKAKNIPLGNELKSLVLTTSNGLYLLHMPGNKDADLRKVKRQLGVKEACLASKETLKSIGVKPGTVCPFLEKLWDLPQLISSELSNINKMSTNNGEQNKYIEFHTSTLFKHPKAKIGIFTK